MPVEPRSDVVSVMPELARIRDMVRRADYSSVASALLDMHDRDDRLLADAGGILAEEPGFHALVDSRLRDVEDDILAQALLAHSHVVGAWRSRGRLAAAQVPPEDMERFLAQLRSAEQLLIQLCAVEPTWSYPWFLRLITARGLELGANEARRRYERLSTVDPHHHPAQAQFLQQLCPKWQGTWEAAEEFTRECVRAARPASAEHALLANLHLERWRVLDPQEGKRYLRREDVLHDLRTSAQASVLHPDHERGLSWVRLHSTFGVLFALAGEREDAETHLAELGDFLDPWVWSCLSAKDYAKVERIRKALPARPGVA